MSAIYDYARQMRAECAQAWALYLDAEMDRAEEACRGYLVRKEYLGQVSATELFEGADLVAYRRATPELIEYWREHPRLTKTAFEYQWLAAEHPEALFGSG